MFGQEDLVKLSSAGCDHWKFSFSGIWDYPFETLVSSSIQW